MIHWLRRYVITEPVVFFAYFAGELSSFGNTNLYFQKACRNDSSSAPDLRTPCDNERRGSDFITTVYNSSMIPNFLVSLLFTIFASTYSDLAGKRRIFMVIALIGHLLKQVVAIGQTIFWSWSPLIGVILTCVAECSFGGWLTLLNFMNTYLFDRTSDANRLTRVTIVSVVTTAGNLMGKACSGILLHECGFLVTFVVCFVLYSLCLVCTLIFVRDERPPVLEERRSAITFGQVFSLRQIREGFVLIAFPHQQPMKHIVSIWLLLVIDFLVNFAFFGELSIFYLYFRERFHWDEEKFSIFSCYRSASSTIGSMFGSLLLSNWLKIHEGIIGAFAAFWDTLAVIGFYFAREDWQLYTVPLFDILHGLAANTCLSQIGQFFTEREFGRLNSMKMIFYAIGWMSSIPVYSALYRITADTHSNAFFLLSTLVSILICVMYSITFPLSRDERIRIPSD